MYVSGRVGWCKCVSCESGFLVYISGQCICILCHADTCASLVHQCSLLLYLIYICFLLYISQTSQIQIFFGKEEFYSDKNSTKKYSVGIIDMIKLRNIYNTYTYIPIYIQLNTHIYMQIKKHKQSKKLRFYKKIKNKYIKTLTILCKME